MLKLQKIKWKSNVWIKVEKKSTFKDECLYIKLEISSLEIKWLKTKLKDLFKITKFDLKIKTPFWESIMWHNKKEKNKKNKNQSLMHRPGGDNCARFTGTHEACVRCLTQIRWENNRRERKGKSLWLQQSVLYSCAAAKNSTRTDGRWMLNARSRIQKRPPPLFSKQKKKI